VLDWSNPAAIETERNRVLQQLRDYNGNSVVWRRVLGLLALLGAHRCRRQHGADEANRTQNAAHYARLGAHACHNADRIIRVPGTINVLGKTKIWAGRKPVVAELVEFHDNRRYRI
jgi:hypothetical protein